jgi:serine/threonine protein kinase
MTTENYNITKEIGAGATSRVYTCTKNGESEKYAMKMISRKKYSKYTNGILNEAHVLSSLNHPNIIKIIEYYEADDFVFEILEYMPRDLFTVYETMGVFNEETAAMYVLQLVKAVAYLHSNGIMHRDIKLENCAVSDNCELKLIDFGSATTEQESGDVYGTKGYLSPEQWNRQIYNNAVDVWAIGVCAYELVVGRAPFLVDFNEYSFLAPPTSFEVELPDCTSDYFKDFITKTMNVDSSARPTAQELLMHPFIIHSRNLPRKHRIQLENTSMQHNTI